MPPCALVRRWRARRASRNRHDEDINEKQTNKRRCNRLDVFAIVVRVLQCLLAWSADASLALLFQSFTPEGAVDDQSRQLPPKYIRKLGSTAVLYQCSVLVFIFLLRRVKTSASWRVFAVGTVLLDLVMMIFAIAIIIVLGIVGLPSGCQAFLKENSFESHNEMRQLVASYSSAFFGVDSDESTKKLNLLCTLPKTVYVLAVISIFSHTLSIVLTALQFQRNSAQRDTEAMACTGHVEEAVPEAIYNRASNRTQPPAPPLPRGYTQHTLSAASQQLVDSIAGPRIQASAPTRSSNLNQHYPQASPNWQNPGPIPGNPPAELFTNPPGWRSSQETTSSFNPDLYLVSDGFRPLPSPPAYTSRPSSLFNART